MTLRQRVLAHLAAGRPDLAYDEAALAASNGPPRDRAWAPTLLADLAPRVPIAAWTHARARALGDRPGPAMASEPGRVAFPAVAPLGGRFATAMVRPVELLADAIPVSREAGAACRSALDAARTALGSDARFEVAFDHVDFEGASCGLAVALAAVSSVRRVPVDPMFAATGHVRPDGHVEPVGSLHDKLRLCAEARPRGILLVPGGSGSVGWRGTAVDTLGAALAACTLPAGGLDDLLKEFAGHEHDGDWQAAARVARRLANARGLDDETRVRALTVRLAAANHEADPALAGEVGSEIASCFDLGVSDLVLARAIASLAVASIDGGDAPKAREVLALAGSRTWSSPAAIHLDGTEARLRVLEGRIEDAVALRREIAGAVPRYSPERPRCLSDLADTLWRVGLLDEAAEVVEQAFSALAEIPTQKGYLARTRGFLHLYAARIHRLRGEVGRAHGHLETAPAMPGADPSVRLGLEAALLEGRPELAEAALRGRRGQSALLDALADRALAWLGDLAAASRLRAYMGAPDDEPLDTLARRLPY